MMVICSVSADGLRLDWPARRVDWRGAGAARSPPPGD